MFHRIKSLPHGLNITSLDAPAVVTCWYWLFSFQYGGTPSLEISWLLFSTTWTIYALDRIFESETELTRPRHLFHQRHQNQFIGLIIAVVILNCGLMWLLPLPLEIYKIAIVLGAASVAYIFQPHLNLTAEIREWGKNLLVATVFSAGCILPVWVQLHPSSTIAPSFWYDGISLWVLALINLRATEYMESANAKKQPNEVWLLSLLLFGTMFMSSSSLKWTWMLSALFTIGSLHIYPKLKRPQGILDIALMIPALTHLVIITLKGVN